MTASKPEVVAYLVQHALHSGVQGVRLNVDHSCVDYNVRAEPLIRQSDHVAEVSKMVELLRQCRPIMAAHAGATHMLEGFKPKRNEWDDLLDRIDAVLGGDA